MTVDDRHWYLLNASPDLRQQIEATPAMWPSDGVRSSPIVGAVLTGGDVDAIAGLLTLRERQPLCLYATDPVLQILEANSVFDVLARDLVQRLRLVPDAAIELTVPGGGGSGLTCTAFGVPGKVPLYLEAVDQPAIREDAGTIGVMLSDSSGGRMFFIPGCAAMTPALADRLRGAALVLFDGTLWTDDEMILAGTGAKTGRRMGHMSIAGPDGTMAAFADLGVQRKVLIHINNSNPVLLDDSPERGIATAQGWEVAWDGMELTA